MAAPTKLEFSVQMKSEKCATSVKSALGGVPGVNVVSINVDKEQVIVETTLPSSQVKDIIETSGNRAVLQGLGSGLSSNHLGAAVAKISGDGTESARTLGVARMIQVDENTCVIDGTVDGLPLGTVDFRIHELGDVSSGCDSCGDVFNMGAALPGAQLKLRDRLANFASVIGFHRKLQPVGDLVQVDVDPSGRAEFRITNNNVKVWDVIGRSLVVHDGQRRLACGIIARSAGLFENTKKICACDGVTLWDERDKPVAGTARQSQPQANL